MFDAIVWIITIIVFVGGIIQCVDRLTSGDGLQICWTIVGIIISLVVFFRIENIIWRLLVTGIVLCLFGADASEEEPPRRTDRGFADAALETFAEYELHKQATKDAIRESRK